MCDVDQGAERRDRPADRAGGGEGGGFGRDQAAFQRLSRAGEAHPGAPGAVCRAVRGDRVAEEASEGQGERSGGRQEVEPRAFQELIRSALNSTISQHWRIVQAAHSGIRTCERHWHMQA